MERVLRLTVAVIFSVMFTGVTAASSIMLYRGAVAFSLWYTDSTEYSDLAEDVRHDKVVLEYDYR